MYLYKFSHFRSMVNLVKNNQQPIKTKMKEKKSSFFRNNIIIIIEKMCLQHSLSFSMVVVVLELEVK